MPSFDVFPLIGAEQPKATAPLLKELWDKYRDKCGVPENSALVAGCMRRHDGHLQQAWACEGAILWKNVPEFP
jgi:hypothetical protein